MGNRVALITGVGRREGIGRAIASRLANDGWDIAFSFWRPYDQRLSPAALDSGPESIEAELNATGRRILAVEADLENPQTPDALLAQVNRELGPVTALVLSHAESVDSSILDTSIESFDRHFAVNTRAAWLLIAAFARQVPETGGAIVALTSDHVAHNLPYGASKGALDRIVNAAAIELGPLGIRANSLNPGPIDTGWMTDDVREALTAGQPSGALGTPEDTADIVSFLVSDQGRWVSGQLLKSDGGFSA
ncbi:SDR family oxidoreductase [Leifsonia poae]|uniref:SDR family oxidoreductase n=1 Tax=Leifsonia poae TaxID=110933 RepID=UPI003D668B4F